VTSTDKTSGAKAARRFTFHPFEVALCGYSGSGKTTLARKLLERWRGTYRVGFAKHDAHRFEMDTPGKDTYEASQAGAASVLINDPRHFARISSLPYSALERTYAFVDADFVLAEGFKRTSLPKLILLDEEGRALSELREGRFENVLAVIGREATGPAGLDLQYFHRDDLDAISHFIEGFFQEAAAAPLYGLILVGGASSRMGRPKWSIEYRGEPQAHRVARLLAGFCDRVFLSVAPGQDTTGMPDLPALEDRFPMRGPVAGLLSAMEAHPEAAWLALACDLPFVEEKTLRKLVASRRRFGIATAYRSAHDELPEPLCAIWEPRSRQRLLQALGVGMGCPRKVLIESATHLVELDDPQALDNANTQEDFWAALSRLSSETTR
jgi:molybdenum cofactor guanylyltransferase